MSCGIPSVTSNYSPFDEIDDDSILKVDITNPEKIKNAIKWLTEGDNYNILSSNARKFITKNHTWESIGMKYLEVIKS